MHCGRTWAFEEKLERRADHQSTKSAVTVRTSPADITLPATAERRHAHPALRILKSGRVPSVNSNCRARVAPRSSCLQFAMCR